MGRTEWRRARRQNLMEKSAMKVSKGRAKRAEDRSGYEGVSELHGDRWGGTAAAQRRKHSARGSRRIWPERNSFCLIVNSSLLRFAVRLSQLHGSAYPRSRTTVDCALRLPA